MKAKPTSKQKLVLQALMHDDIIQAAAEKAGVSPSAVIRWILRDEQFIKQLKSESQKIYEFAAAFSRSQTNAALSKLYQLMECGDKRIELSAVKEFLSFAESKAAQEKGEADAPKEFTVNIKVV